MSAVLAMSALLKAGVSPRQVMEYSAGALDSVGQKFRQQVDLIWGFAIRQGASLSEALEQLHQNQRRAAELSEKLKQANSVPKSTRQLMMWLPPISLALAEMGGLKPLAGLLTPLGASVAAFGCALLFLGWYLSGQMLQRASQPLEQYLGLVLVQLGLRSGLSIDSARVAAVISQPLLEIENSAIERVAIISKTTGAPVIDLLDAALTQLLSEQESIRIEAVGKLSVRLLLPLSLTVIPAMLMLTVVPIFIGLFGGGEL